MHRSLINCPFRLTVGFLQKLAQGDPPRRFSAAAEMV